MPKQGSYPMGSRTLANGDTLTGVATGDTADVPVETMREFVISTGELNPDNTIAPGSFDGTETWSIRKAGAWARASLSAAAGWIVGLYAATLQSGTGAASRTLKAAVTDIATPEGYSAVGDGVTVDSTPFNNAIAARQNVMPSSGKQYSIGDIALSNSQSFRGNHATVNAAAGATHLFTLSNYNPAVGDLYVSSGANASGPLFKISSGRYARISNVAVVNAGAGGGILLHDDAGTAVARPTIDRFDVEDFTTIGLEMDSSVSELRASNMLLAGYIDYSGGLGKPRAGTVGWQQNTPVVGSLAVGGHQVSGVNCISCQTGWHISNAQLSFYSDVLADSCTGYGVRVDGTSQYVDFSNLFVGTTMGVYVGDSANVNIRGLHTILNGTVPPWGQAGFFDGTAYDITVAGTAVLTVQGWRGDKKLNVASTAKLVVLDGTTFQGRCTGTIGAGATTYLSSWGATPTEGDAGWRAPCPGRLLRLTPTVTAAPGASQSFTYTARKNGADTTLTAAISGSGAFGAVDTWEGTGGIAVNTGDLIAIKLVTSASAAAAEHYCELQFVPN